MGDDRTGAPGRGEQQTRLRSDGCLIGLDLGTSAAKGVLVSSAGRIVSTERLAFRYDTYADGRMEFDPAAMYDEVVAPLLRKLAAALPAGGAVAALAMASASGNTVLSDARGEPLMPAISWMDKRVTDEIAAVFGPLDERQVHDIVGWPLMKQFPLAHLAWLKRHRPQLLQRAAAIGMSTDAILFRLAGRRAMDYSTATTFYLQDQCRADWHTPYLERLGIDRGQLPQLAASGTVLGRLTARAAAQTGLSTETAVVLGAFDHPSAARGTGVLEEGDMLLSCGTSWVGFYPVRERLPAITRQLLVDPYLQPSGCWGAMLSLPEIADAIDRWVIRRVDAGPDRYKTLGKLAQTIEPGEAGLIVNPLRAPEEGGGQAEGAAPAAVGQEEEAAPAADAARSTPPGAANRARSARAIMEGTVFLLRSALGRLAGSGMAATSVAMVGGPSETDPWPQIVADVLGVEVRTGHGGYAGAVGAAVLAGIGLGAYADEAEARRLLAPPDGSRIHKPNRAAQARYEALYRQFVERHIDFGGLPNG